MELPGAAEERVAAIAVRLINLAWFRVGPIATRAVATFGITTLRKSHVTIRGARITFAYRGKHGIAVRSAIVDRELPPAVRELRELPGAAPLSLRERRWSLRSRRRAAQRLHPHHLGAEFTAKDFRTWGGTLVAAVASPSRRPSPRANARRRSASRP